jgi:hypothetical protein
MVIGQDGNVGIGTTNPAYKLDVAGDINGNRLCIRGDCKDSWPTGGQNYWVLSGNNLTPSSTAWNVGIGTTEPGEKLHVAGGNAVIGYVYNSSGGVYITQSARYGQPAIQGVTPTFAPGTLAINPVGGNVGIGTTAPTAKLDVKGKLYVDPTNFGGTPTISLAIGDTDTGINWESDGRLVILSNNKEMMGFSADNPTPIHIFENTYINRLGVGISPVPQYNLYVDGDAAFNSSVIITGERKSQKFSRCEEGKTLNCSSGKGKVISGGCDCGDGVVKASYPTSDGFGWFCKCSGIPPVSCTISVICARLDIE